MNLQQCLLTNNACYLANQHITVRGIMWHSTGADNPELRRYVQPDDGKLGRNAYGNHWNTMYPDGQAVCVHAFIGKLKDGSIATYQTLPWAINGWHCGGSGNDGYIGFEICEDDLTDEAYFQAVYQEAVELSAYLCKMFQLDPLLGETVIDHSRGAALGIASDHSDVMSWFSRYGVTMESIRQDIARKMTGAEGELTMTQYEELKQLIADNVRWIDDTLAQQRDQMNERLEALQAETKALKAENERLAALPAPEWAKAALQYCIDHKILQGDGKDAPTVDNIRPMSHITRAEVAQVLYNADVAGEEEGG